MGLAYLCEQIFPDKECICLVGLIKKKSFNAERRDHEQATVRCQRVVSKRSAAENCKEINIIILKQLQNLKGLNLQQLPYIMSVLRLVELSKKRKLIYICNSFEVEGVNYEEEPHQTQKATIQGIEAIVQLLLPDV